VLLAALLLAALLFLLLFLLLLLLLLLLPLLLRVEPPALPGPPAPRSWGCDPPAIAGRSRW
jgi:hypothetical protein